MKRNKEIKKLNGDTSTNILADVVLYFSNTEEKVKLGIPQLEIIGNRIVIKTNKISYTAMSSLQMVELIFLDNRKTTIFSDLLIKPLEFFKDETNDIHIIEFKTREDYFFFDCKDFIGKSIYVGNEIVYPCRKGSSLWMNKGIVIEIKKENTYTKVSVPVLFVLTPKGNITKITNISNVVVI